MTQWTRIIGGSKWAFTFPNPNEYKGWKELIVSKLASSLQLINQKYLAVIRQQVDCSSEKRQPKVIDFGTPRDQSIPLTINKSLVTTSRVETRQ